MEFPRDLSLGLFYLCYTYINDIVENVLCELGNLRNCPKNLKELSYKQFVVPVLEYAATIWDPYHQNDINKIEIIQNRAASFVLSRP